MIFWLEVKKKQTKTDEHSKTQQKPNDSNRMVTVDIVENSWKNAVLAKYTENDWLTFDRRGRHASNLFTLLPLCKRYN